MVYVFAKIKVNIEYFVKKFKIDVTVVFLFVSIGEMYGDFILVKIGWVKTN